MELLSELLKRLDIKSWDFVIIGDGSGSSWNKEAGWSSVSIERVTGERLVWAGCMNRGTVNFAEIMAYLQPLNWLVAREADRRQKNKIRRQAYQIHIITDSEYTSNTGASSNRMMAKNGVLWAAFDVFVRQGFVLNWHWLRRDSCALNNYTDRLSRMARILIKKNNLQDRMEKEVTDYESQTIYEINPSED